VPKKFVILENLSIARTGSKQTVPEVRQRSNVGLVPLVPIVVRISKWFGELRKTREGLLVKLRTPPPDLALVGGGSTSSQWDPAPINVTDHPRQFAPMSGRPIYWSWPRIDPRKTLQLPRSSMHHPRPRLSSSLLCQALPMSSTLGGTSWGSLHALGIRRLDDVPFLLQLRRRMRRSRPFLYGGATCSVVPDRSSSRCRRSGSACSTRRFLD